MVHLVIFIGLKFIMNSFVPWVLVILWEECLSIYRFMEFFNKPMIPFLIYFQSGVTFPLVALNRICANLLNILLHPIDVK